MSLCFRLRLTATLLMADRASGTIFGSETQF